jgi:hypothetical protein
LRVDRAAGPDKPRHGGESGIDSPHCYIVRRFFSIDRASSRRLVCSGPIHTSGDPKPHVLVRYYPNDDAEEDTQIASIHYYFDKDLEEYLVCIFDVLLRLSLEG